MTNNRLRRITAALAVAVVVFSIFAAPARTYAGEAPVCGAASPVAQAHENRLRTFAETVGLKKIRAFAGTVSNILKTGRAPDCYQSKRKARSRGWRPGGDLCALEPGIAIGAYPFENREKLLPREYEGSYRIADLDYDCGKRNARRLVYVEGRPGTWLMWVTLDHYKSYTRVPAP